MCCESSNLCSCEPESFFRNLLPPSLTLCGCSWIQMWRDVGQIIIRSPSLAMQERRHPSNLRAVFKFHRPECITKSKMKATRFLNLSVLAPRIPLHPSLRTPLLQRSLFHHGPPKPTQIHKTTAPEPTFKPFNAFNPSQPHPSARVAPKKPSTATPSDSDDSGLKPEKVPAFELTFTCKPCQNRSAHRISKQGFYHGSILITCPSCKNRHVISDHLKVRD